jgi:pentatricopeptide repeat protein
MYRMEQQGNFPSVRDCSMLIESLAAAERVSEASRLVHEMLSHGIYPLPRVFRFILNKLALSGDIEAIASIGIQLDDVRDNVNTQGQLGRNLMEQSSPYHKLYTIILILCLLSVEFNQL